ncbi:hypothetical protein O3P69_002219 [Scylla paramamosain]|uniref:SRA1/Sec31 domain-containing protein n=1 Tax=Scylla paramamosain TaxID=85552 RepID=A0AAW0V860_SCYPA
MDGTGHGNPERGWNDPPKLAFCPTRTGNASGPGRHRLLNKRVPIPVNPQASSAPSTMPPSLKASDGPPVKGSLPLHPPPLTPCPQPPSAYSMPSAAPTPPSTGGVEDTQATRELLEQVHTGLSNSLEAVSGKLKESTQEEIRKRMEVMVDMWQKDQLTLEVQKRMMALIQALSEHDYDKAWSVHQSLIVDYTTTCSPWMVGIKTLIAESRGHSQATLEQDKDTDESKKKLETEGDAVPASDEGEGSVSDVSSVK